VTDELTNNLRGRTTLVITHRASLVHAADYVFVLSGGRIIQEGAPRALLQGDGSWVQGFGREMVQVETATV
jgi:ATP-binding cassette subfamily B protein